jgi:hypothetical protein
VEFPGFKNVAIRPLEYGTIVELYENRPRTPATLARIFSAAIAPCSEEQVKGMQPAMPAVLEYGVLLASGLLERTKHEGKGGRLEDSDDDYGDVVREDSQFAAHKSANQTKGEIDDDLADFLYVYVGNYGTPLLDVYSLTIGEINAIRKGHNNAEKEKRKNHNSNSGASVSRGNAQDRIGSRRNLG